MIKATSSYLNLAPRSEEQAARDIAKSRAAKRRIVAECNRRLEVRAA